jgi:ubiquitin-like-conjugating enzyme ATG10
VIHDIVHSPTWNVPVLYFHCAHLPRGVAPSPDTIYECVVPDACKRPLATPGLSPMGSLSLTEHPVSARPVYWVHPCRTREAMAQVLGGKAADEAGAVGWLMAWFGLIGAHVGLTLPVELVRVLEI